MTCIEPHCGKEGVARGLCQTCYGRRWRRGDFAQSIACCVEDGCAKAAVTGGRCHRCHLRWDRAQNPERYARYNANRRPVRMCRDCGAVRVEKKAQLCADCRTAVRRRKVDERHRNLDMVRQLEEMRRVAHGGPRRRARTRTKGEAEAQIGADANDVTRVAMLREVAHDPCAYCGGPCEAIDHIEPLAAGGERSIENVTAACDRCNSRKSKRPLLAFLLVQRIDGQLEPLATQRRLAVAI